jgi:hypothetical protein
MWLRLCPVLLQDCWFEQSVNLADAQAPAVRLPGCHLPGLRAEQLTTRGNLELNNGLTTNGEVHLRGAHIGGQLSTSALTAPGWTRSRPSSMPCPWTCRRVGSCCIPRSCASTCW